MEWHKLQKITIDTSSKLDIHQESLINLELQMMNQNSQKSSMMTKSLKLKKFKV